jgi:hypothetical protein
MQLAVGKQEIYTKFRCSGKLCDHIELPGSKEQGMDWPKYRKFYL